MHAIIFSNFTVLFFYQKEGLLLAESFSLSVALVVTFSTNISNK